MPTRLARKWRTLQNGGATEQRASALPRRAVGRWSANVEPRRRRLCRPVPARVTINNKEKPAREESAFALPSVGRALEALGRGAMVRFAFG